MKRAAIIHYTDRGAETAQRIAQAIQDEFAVEQYRSKCCMEALFLNVDALVFVGATGIAVRAIAPYLKNKTSDPAVVVADERGINVISLISGHIGGANALTRRIAERIGAYPVITTATDINQRFAVDEWAAKREIWMDSMQAAKRFAVEILKRDLPMSTDFPVRGSLPSGLFRAAEGEFGMCVSVRDDSPFENTLHLVPKILHLGIGCKRGTSAEAIEEALQETLSAQKLSIEAIKNVASIDVKQNEAGLLAFCKAHRWPVQFFSAEELAKVEGEFTASAFVRRTVGVDNVCERAAMRAAGAGSRLVVRKNCFRGVTIAAAQEEWSVCFE